MSTAAYGDQDIPEYPMPRTDPLDLPPGLSELRNGPPLTRVRLRDGNVAWLVTGWREAREVLSDNRFSADLRTPGYPQLRPSSRHWRAGFGTNSKTSGPTLLRMDPPRHDELRRMLAGYFTHRRITAMRAMVQGMAGACLDDMERRGAPADIVADLCIPLPSMVICELLGVSVADRPHFESLTASILAASTSQRDAIRALRSLVAYIDRLVTEKEQEPGDDILGMLVRDYASQGLISHADLVSTAGLLLAAGHETTANMLGLSLVALLEERRDWDALREAPAKIPGAVEEFLRYHTIAHSGIPRVAMEDVRVADQLVKAGVPVLISVAAANRDPAVFLNPDALRVDREEAGRHLSFGFGIHQCLGQSLARLELEVALASVLRRFPAMRMAGKLGDVAFGHDRIIYGVEQLMVTW
jgi:cytochrome P450